MNNKGQIGETVTWMVGTIVIIVILAIAIFIVQFNMNKKEFTPYLSNDLIVTKSFFSFLKHDSNFESLQNSINSGNYDSFKKKLEPFFKSVSTKGNWNFRVFIDDKVIGKSVVDNGHHNFLDAYVYLYFKLNDKKINLRFDEVGKNG